MTINEYCQKLIKDAPLGSQLDVDGEYFTKDSDGWLNGADGALVSDEGMAEDVETWIKNGARWSDPGTRATVNLNDPTEEW